MASDSSAVDAAVVGRLLNDAQLSALMPGGIYWGVGVQGAVRFVMISQAFHVDVPMQMSTSGSTAYEQFTYTVLAVELSTSGANIQAAARRIHALLHDTTFPITGYDLMLSQRIERLKDTITDADNPDARWQYLGGSYQVTVSPLP